MDPYHTNGPSNFSTVPLSNRQQSSLQKSGTSPELSTGNIITPRSKGVSSAADDETGLLQTPTVGQASLTQQWTTPINDEEVAVRVVGDLSRAAHECLVRPKSLTLEQVGSNLVSLCTPSENYQILSTAAQVPGAKPPSKAHRGKQPQWRDLDILGAVMATVRLPDASINGSKQ
ncbi:hypothetical protein FGB62_9g14 [Gracilaria domingensis]|nr:hypothetical protein FGB62_9g14 [Gracilaria domingensis]